ncbi:MAG: hypothetical protein GJT30_03730 [Geobacter sp.]|nr:hypothetical protein [Geobacter sp.]
MKVSIITFIAIVSIHSVAFGITAFPGAVGVGANTLGGRGGKVIKVTNLNDSGAGSLREALATSGPRIIVFTVSGNINLTSLLYITQPYVTIAGQTSPGGISVSGKQFNVATHDVIIRHMRFRAGGHLYTGDDSDGDSFSLWGKKWGGNDVYNVMIDHCSMTWGVDETFSITGGVTKTTLQNNLIAQGLRYAKLGGSSDHSKGLMVSGKNDYDTEVSLYRNYIAHNTDRNPLMYNPAADNTNFYVDGTNNVSYNWKGGLRPSFGGDAHVNWIANYAKEGPYSTASTYFMQQEDGGALATPEQLLYVSGNKDSGTTSTSDWRVSQYYTVNLLSTAYQKSTRWVMTNPLPYDTMTDSLASSIVAASGATVPIRDSVDTAIVNSFNAGTSLLKDTASYPNDWPTYQQIAAPVDSDNDGMPDTWETAHGLNNSINDSAADRDGDGYTNIEEYINSLADNLQIARPAAPQNPKRTN